MNIPFSIIKEKYPKGIDCARFAFADAMYDASVEREEKELKRKLTEKEKVNTWYDICIEVAKICKVDFIDPRTQIESEVTPPSMANDAQTEDKSMVEVTPPISDIEESILDMRHEYEQ